MEGRRKNRRHRAKNGPSRNKEVERKLVGKKKITFVPSVLVDIFGTFANLLTYFNRELHICDTTPLILASFKSRNCEFRQSSLAMGPLASVFSSVK